MPAGPTAARTRIREVVTPDDPAISGAYRLLKRAFSGNERIPERAWRDSLDERANRVWTDIAWHLLVAERGEEVIGFTSGNYLGNVNLGVVGYLAIEPGTRARGLGTRLRQQLIGVFEADAKRIAHKPLAGLIGEVKATNPWLSRLARRPEVLLLDFSYLQPRLRLFDRASSYVLYYEDIHRPLRRFPTAELRQVLYTLWRRVYRISRPLARPEFRAMLQSLGERRSVGPRLVPNQTKQ